MDTKGNIIADVTIDELNAAIAIGDITYVDTSKSDESAPSDTNVLESSISDNDLEGQRQRIEEINLIIDLYNQIQGNQIEGKTFTSLNDMMVYLQQLNPKAVNLYNDIKILANRQIVDGKIVNVDEEIKTPSDIIQEASKTLDKAVAENRQNTKDNGYFFNLVNLNDSKVYSRIGQLRTNDTVSVELDENGNLIVKSRGIKIGEFPKIGYNNGNVEVILLETIA